MLMVMQITCMYILDNFEVSVEEDKIKVSTIDCFLLTTDYHLVIQFK